MKDLRARAEDLVGRPVRRSDLALVFEETVAAAVDVYVEGRNFYPPILAILGIGSIIKGVADG